MSEERALEVAVSLMRLALPLLDRVGGSMAAVRLQHAIDTALEVRPLQPGDEFADEMVAMRVVDRLTARRMGERDAPRK